ncbi:MAG TPA: FAD-binding oxidoreductase [Candidatus Acidoferrum sp.]|nr:FAD-binding oxidoreductase [Candidatus Acidoferrum sp.]
MSPKTHPWGTPPWTVDFRPTAHPLPDQVDFAIVGGGFTGLSAAAWLRRLAPKKSVLVLETSSLGEGASGRTGGLALADTAAGPMPGLGDVLAGYKKILRALRISAGLELPGVWELSRSNPAKGSPISWNDSGNLQVVRTVPGGAVDPGKVVSGLARAAQNAGAQIVEHAEVHAIDYSNPPRLHVRQKIRARIQQKEIIAGQVLLATNAFSLELSELQGATQATLTLALATAPLTAEQLKAIGLASRHPFYTIDLPYLWGRLLASNGVVFGAGLVPMPASIASLFTKPAGHPQPFAAPDLYRFDVRKGEAAESFRWLESRVHQLHPVLKSVRITHRWAGPILFTEGMRPIFRRHPRSESVKVLAGYNGHGVALSVYLGQWAAEALLGTRSLPSWS